MGWFVVLPLVLPLTAWPIAKLAEHQLHPRSATWLLTGVGVVMASCSTVCVGLVMVVGTAQLPGNPLPDGWSDPEVAEAVPFEEVAAKAAIPALAAVLLGCGRSLWRHLWTRRRVARALAGVGSARVAVVPDEAAYAYALPGGGRGRIVASTGLLGSLSAGERRALFAHERAHLAGRHHRLLLAVTLAARAHPFLRPLRTAVLYTAERWADEEAAREVGDRRLVARAIGRAALVSRGGPVPAFAGAAGAGAVSGAGPGPVPRRVAALLAPPPVARPWPPTFTAVGLACWTAAAGAAASALSSANSAVTMFLLLKAATPL
ncbi:M56 family metallopeptidase [Streptomyces sp. YIM 98790]|uniref:M56 family metallopeptidase n=1 Tax=Streptomyces sp. YIM 98790 TaxID=2689077 RepID=UPI00140C9492|nr:M56 family metallopeptidase [Streptomyces sp. YIM 98790]